MDILRQGWNNKLTIKLIKLAFKEALQGGGNKVTAGKEETEKVTKI